MIHCTTEDLLALKGGEGSAWSRRHLTECAHCQGELDGLHQRVAQLKALPVLNPPRDRWPALRDRLMTERRRTRSIRTRWASVALAASIAAVMTAKSVEQRRVLATHRQDLQTLVSRSQQLEETLRQYDPQSRVMSAAAAGAVAELEDRIAAVDVELGHNPASTPRLDLWRQRVQLMEGLVNVNVARAAYLGM